MSSPHLDAADFYEEVVHRFLSDVDRFPDSQDPIVRFSEEIRRMGADLEREMVRPRRILVLGGAGYIGSVLVRRLLERGYRVRVLDALLYDNAASLEIFSEDPKFEFVQGDLLQDEILHRCLQGVTDVVLLAALVGDPICEKYPEQAKQVNYQGTVGVLEALTNYHINKLVFTSTCSNYGIFQGHEPANEEAPLRPMSIYAETKVAAERYILEHRGQLDYSPTILRLATAFGMGHRTRFDLTVNHFTRELAMSKELVVYDEATWRPYCHVEDISEAIIRVLDYPREMVDFQVFNVGGNEQNYSKQQIVELVRRAVPEARVEYQAGGSDPRDYRVDFGKIHRELGFSLRYSADSCIDELVQAMRCGRFTDVEERETFYGNYRIPVFDATP